MMHQQLPDIMTIPTGKGGIMVYFWIAIPVYIQQVAHNCKITQIT